MRKFEFWKRLISGWLAAPPPSFCEPEVVQPEPRSDGKHPKGKGIFVQTVQRATKAGTPEALAEFAESLGMDWVMLLCIWQHEDRDRIYKQTTEAARALRDRGIDVWVWGWPHPGAKRIDRFVSHMHACYVDCEAEGVVLNVEAPFYGRRQGMPKHEAAAKELMSELRVKMPDAPIGLSSYGALFWHRSAFPWEVFAQECDFGAPQIYDIDEKHGWDYPERCVRAWKGAGFRVICPTLAASKNVEPREMQDKLRQMPEVPAISWWDMNHLRYSNARQEVVRGLEL